ncbi:MAG: hypothetical protein E6I83_10480 [Chloroflexi bacterium]|nr:MAG: hypothetical protein E6I83_10480 [Chloroflexota bacterium]
MRCASTASSWRVRLRRRPRRRSVKSEPSSSRCLRSSSDRRAPLSLCGPLAFGAIYRGTDGVRDLLRTRATEFADRLRAVDGRAEWIVSIEREGSGALEGDAVRVLDAEIAAAAPGRAFLLRKRRDEVARDERRMRDVAVAEEARATIEAIAERVYREPLIEDPTAAAVARFSVLANRDREVELGDVVRRLGATGTSAGYRVRLSGPWPAYRFGGLPSDRVASA